MEVMEVKDYIIQECFSMNLRWYRHIKNLTQEQLAELSNLNPKYISDLERGKYSPSLGKLEALARALEIEPYMLIKPNLVEENSKDKVKS